MKSSVIIPNIGTGRRIHDAIISAVNQSVPPSIVCVVDDCTHGEDIERISSQFQMPVSSATSCAKINDQTTLMLLLNQAAKTLPSLLNTGLNMAMISDIVCVLDPFDTLMPKFMEEVVYVLSTKPNISCVYGDSVVHLPNNQTVIKRHKSFDSIQCMDNVTYADTIAIKKETVQQVGGFSDNLMDACIFEFLIRACRYGVPYHVAKAITNSTYHEQTSQTANIMAGIRHKYLLET